jgi:hypothetical protein
VRRLHGSDVVREPGPPEAIVSGFGHGARVLTVAALIVIGVSAGFIAAGRAGSCPTSMSKPDLHHPTGWLAWRLAHWRTNDNRALADPYTRVGRAIGSDRASGLT